MSISYYAAMPPQAGALGAEVVAAYDSALIWRLGLARLYIACVAAAPCHLLCLFCPTHAPAFT